MVLGEGLPDVPTQLTALSILGFIVVWFLRRMDRTDAQRDTDVRDKDAEIAALQTRIETLLVDNADQRRMKHDALNKATVDHAQLGMFKKAARKCDCGAMSGLASYFDDL